MIYFSDKKIHFIGIGGIGMSAIAESLFNMGIHVQGSNNVQNTNCTRLEKKGIPIFYGHNNFLKLDGVDCVIISSAISEDNPELVEVKRRNIPVGHRSEMLSELMRYKKGIAISGTHGKTTTTAMIADIFSKAGLNPSFIIGGIINSQLTNSKNGNSDWMIVEADESDGSFLKLPKMIALVTNIDSEHMDYYGSFEEVKKAYQYFLETTSFYGFNCVCSDHPVISEIVSKIKRRRIITYGFNEKADVQATHVTVKADHLSFDIKTKKAMYKGFELPMFGRHNILNALGAFIVSKENKISPNKIKEALASFNGVYRRFTHVGTINDIHIYDDYAHHPTEISAVLKAAKEANPDHKTIAIFQPHRYSRAFDLQESFASCFKQADTVIVSDIFSAGEDQIHLINKEILAKKIKESGHPNVLVLESFSDLPALVVNQAHAGDFVIGLGAGDISKWIHELPAQLERINPLC